MCLPSKAEGMPLVLVEALGALTPTIFSRECNASEIAREGAGIELDSLDASAWAQALDELSSDSNLRSRMKCNARRIRDVYEWRAIGRRWLTAYRSIQSE